MALDPDTFTSKEQHGGEPGAPSYIEKLTFAGDAAYATGGSANFKTVVGTAIGRIVTVTDVRGYGYTAGALTHFVRYDDTNDKLLVYLLSDGTQASAAANLSSVTFDVTVFWR